MQSTQKKIMNCTSLQEVKSAQDENLESREKELKKCGCDDRDKRPECTSVLEKYYVKTKAHESFICKTQATQWWPVVQEYSLN